MVTSLSLYFTTENILTLLLLITIVLFAIPLFCMDYIERIIQYPEYIFVLVALSLPLERIGAISKGGINIKISQILFIVYIILLLFKLIKTKSILKVEIKKNITYIFVLLFSLSILLSLSVSPNMTRSTEVMIFDIFILLVFFLVSNFITTENLFKQIVRTLIWSSVILSIFGLYQFLAGMFLPLKYSLLTASYSKAVFGFPRVMGTENEPQYWGNFLIIPLSLSFTKLLNILSSSNLAEKITHSKRVKEIIEKIKMNRRDFIFFSIVFVLVSTNIFLTFSRGAWYASIVALITILYFFIRKIINLKFILTISLFSLIIILGIIFIIDYAHAPLSFNSFVSRASAVTDSDRTLTINSAIQFFDNHKLIGIGPGSFGPYMAPNYYTEPSSLTQIIGWRITNNEYIEVLAEEGIVGIVFFSLLLITIARNIYNALSAKDVSIENKLILYALTAVFLAFLVQYYAFSTLYIMQIWFMFGLVNALSFNIVHGWKKEN